MWWKIKSAQEPTCVRKGFGRLLEGRMVYCLNCESDQTLTANASSQMVCSVCAGHSWLYASTPIAGEFSHPTSLC
jgi:ribosomal protein S27E